MLIFGMTLVLINGDIKSYFYLKKKEQERKEIIKKKNIYVIIPRLSNSFADIVFPKN